jgi:hypothetical protein
VGTRIGGGIVVLVVAAACVAVWGPPAIAGTTGPFTVTMSDRESVRGLFYAVHEAGDGIDSGWTGSISGCDPGTVSQAFRDATLARINYFRAMAGVPSTVVFTDTNNTRAQAAALIMSAQNDLSHTPPTTWSCWSDAGRIGAGYSNLILGSTGPEAIDDLMYDGGPGNAFTGRRRKMLLPSLAEMGTGSVPATAGHPAAQAELAGARPGTVTPRDGFVAWPPKGYVPYQLVYPRWSFMLSGADFSSATVSMTGPGNVPVPSTIVDRSTFLIPGMVWEAGGLADGGRWPRPTSDEPITVRVENVIVNGSPRQFTYTTTVFDPADADPTHTRLRIAGPGDPTVNQANAYTVTSIPNASGYQWRTTRLVPFTSEDGAEPGPVHWTASPHSYTSPSTDFAASGSHSFRLTIAHGGGLEPEPQTLTLDGTLVPNAGTVLSFKSRTALLDGQDAAVEVSTDAGSTWTPVYAQGNEEGRFTSHHVSLAGFARKPVQVRFRMRSAGSDLAVADVEGWYIDDIAIGNVQAADPAVSTGVLPDARFSFTPTELAEYDVQVRADFPGSGFGAWSAPKRVSTHPSSSSAQALDAPQLPWSTVGGPGWSGETSATHDGVDALSSGTVADGGSTSIETTIVGETNLRFWWKSASDAGDVLRVTVDGVEPFPGISGAHAWERKAIRLTDGPHTVRWTFSRDGGGSAGADAAYIDQVTTSAK